MSGHVIMLALVGLGAGFAVASGSVVGFEAKRLVVFVPGAADVWGDSAGTDVAEMFGARSLLWCGDMTAIETRRGKVRLARFWTCSAAGCSATSCPSTRMPNWSRLTFDGRPFTDGQRRRGDLPLRPVESAEYTAEAFQTACRHLGVLQSTGRVGCTLGNAAAEVRRAALDGVGSRCAEPSAEAGEAVRRMHRGRRERHVAMACYPARSRGGARVVVGGVAGVRVCRGLFGRG
jgi:hypothetical protein